MNTNGKRLINYRPMLASAIGFAAGILFAVKLGFGGALPGGAALLIALILPASALAAALIGAVRRNGWLFTVGLFFLIGILRVQLFAPYCDVPPEAEDGGLVTVTGTVTDISSNEINTKLTLSDAEADGTSFSHKLLLKAENRNASHISVGDRVSARCTYVKVPETEYQGYDERLQRLANGVSLTAYSSDISVISHDNAPITQLFESARESIASHIESVFGDNAALVKGFILGEKTDIPDDVYSAFVTGGIAHLLTLSGFHVGLLSALIYFLIPKRRRLLRFFVTACVLLLYCALTGFSPSLVRAALMCLTTLAAPAFDRRPDPLSSLSFAAVVILAVNPFKLFSAGFLLSFAATLGILFMVSFGAGRAKHKPFSKLVEYAVVTLGASGAVTLIAAAIFGYVYPYNLLANVVCVPLLSAAILISMILTALSYLLSGFSALAAAVPNTLFNASKWLLERISLLPHACVSAVRPSTLTCLLALICLFSVSAYVLRPMKTRIKIGACVFALFTASVIADIITV